MRVNYRGPLFDYGRNPAPLRAADLISDRLSFVIRAPPPQQLGRKLRSRPTSLSILSYPISQTTFGAPSPFARPWLAHQSQIRPIPGKRQRIPLRGKWEARHCGWRRATRTRTVGRGVDARDRWGNGTIRRGDAYLKIYHVFFILRTGRKSPFLSPVLAR